MTTWINTQELLMTMKINKIFSGILSGLKIKFKESRKGKKNKLKEKRKELNKKRKDKKKRKLIKSDKKIGKRMKKLEKRKRKMKNLDLKNRSKISSIETPTMKPSIFVIH